MPWRVYTKAGIHMFMGEGQDMPFTVAVDSTSESVHQTGPKEWQSRIGKIPVVVS